MDSNKHAELLTMYINGYGDDFFEFMYVYCYGYDIRDMDTKNGFIVVLSPLTEYRLPKSDAERFKWMSGTRGKNFYPRDGAADFLESVRKCHNTDLVFDIFSFGRAFADGAFDVNGFNVMAQQSEWFDKWAAKRGMTDWNMRKVDMPEEAKDEDEANP